ncbi:MAG TPA: glycosyltransferase family 39 protein [Anaerolineales bacterium]|nr:glycosyltransferase family 39 protein [Anaerolineales bacterium]
MILTGIVALAALLRLWGIGSAPLALQYDEAVNGLTAERILAGEHPGLLMLKDGREPIHFYLVAASIAVLGKTPGALRLPFVLGSIGLVLAVWLLARELFGRKVGWLAALLCAGTLWPVYLGRYGTRSVLFALVTALALFSAARAWRSRVIGWWVVAGLLFGISYYTYPINLFVLPAIVLVLAGAALWRSDAVRANGREIAVMIAVTALLALPMWLYRGASLAQSFSRPQHLAVFYVGQGPADFVKTLAAQTVLVLRMLFLRGDANPLHNIPGRPVFDAAMALPFFCGLATLTQACYRRRGMVTAAWAVLFLLPTFLSKSAPHFLRAVGILPVLFVFPALGLLHTHRWLHQTTNRAMANLLVSGLMAISVFVTARDFLLRDFLNSPYVYRAYNGEETSLALQINRRLGVGWTGSNLAARSGPPRHSVHIWVDPAVWDGNPYAQFLVPGQLDELPGLHTLSSSAELSTSAGALFVHPRNMASWLQKIPAGRTARVEPGPWLFDLGTEAAQRLYHIVSW